MCAYTCVCQCVCNYAHVYVYPYSRACTLAHLCVPYVFVCACTCRHVCVCVCVCVCVRVFIICYHVPIYVCCYRHLSCSPSDVNIIATCYSHGKIYRIIMDQGRFTAFVDYCATTTVSIFHLGVNVIIHP